MTLKDQPEWPKPRYNSQINNITTEFFIPALRESTTYQRMAGFFSSTSLSLAARGIKELIDNDGKMQLIVSPIFTEEDVGVLKSDATKRDMIIEKSLTSRLDLASDFEKNHVAALAYLLKKGFLEIRVKIPTDTNGIFLDYESIMKENILGEKFGIFQDRNGHAISFRGPVNENQTSWERGTFEITVDADWIEGQRIQVEEDAARFRKKWEDPQLLTLPQTIQKTLLMQAPKTAAEIDLKQFDIPPWALLPDGRKLWNHQIRAINSWINYDRCGILSMATSGGKTLTALVATELVPNDSIVLILVPTSVLVDQWKRDIHRFDPDIDLVVCSNDHTSWPIILSGKMGPYVSREHKRDRHLLVLSTMKTASSDRFLKNFEHLQPRFITIIADEVHHLGAETYSRIFEINAQNRLGLSATFVRDWDEIGTNKIRDYFRRELDSEYTVKEGICDGKLSRYEYRPFFALLNKSEYSEYSEYSEIIRKVYAQMQNVIDPVTKEKLEKKYSKNLMNRSKIIKKAKDKIRVYGQILLSSPKKPYIVFADDNNHINNLKEMHKKTIRCINFERFNNLEKDDIMTFSGELDPNMRERVLEESKNNQTPLFAMNCLDEGVDVPEFRSAILVSSSTSKRQYIQRRGRILRTSRNKVAYLYDIIVLPNPHSYAVDMTDVKAIVKKEKIRINELAKDATNKWDAIQIFEDKIKELGLDTNT